MKMFCLRRFLPRPYIQLLLVLVIITLLFNSFVSRQHFAKISCSSSNVDANIQVASDQDTPDCNLMGKKCQAVGLVLLISTSAEAREASGLLKTVLQFRTRPLHVHFLVSSLTHPIIETLMGTWQLQEVQFTLYQLDIKHTDRQQWLMTRFRVLTHLPKNLTQVIYLDSLMRLTADISSLTRPVECSPTPQQYTVGLVPLSCGGAAAGNEAQQLECFWSRTSVMFYKRGGKEGVEDSPLISALLSAQTPEDAQSVLSKMSGEVYPIPCGWQIQLTPNFDPAACLKQDPTVKGIVWSGSVEVYTRNVDVETAKETVFSILRSAPAVNQKLTCRMTSRADDGIANHTIDTTDRCAMFKYALSLKRRTHLHYLGDFPEQSDAKPFEEDEVTLMVQLSVDRFTVLERILSNWKGPASIVFYVTDEEAMIVLDKVRQSSVLETRPGVAYHLVYKRQYYNPINYLRNVALNHSRTAYALSLDVDLVPNPGIYESIRKNLKDLRKNNSKEVLVVAAFEVPTDPGEKLPKNKEEMLTMLKEDKISGYSMKRGWNLGHKPTNYPLWKTSAVTYPAVFHDAYEPYVVVPTTIHPRYHEGLLERMGDKIAYARQLHAEGYGFRVLNEDFVIHIPHPKSSGTMRYGKDKNLYHCGSVFFEKFRRDLAAQHPDRKF